MPSFVRLEVEPQLNTSRGAVFDLDKFLRWEIFRVDNKVVKITFMYENIDGLEGLEGAMAERLADALEKHIADKSIENGLDPIPVTQTQENATGIIIPSHAAHGQNIIPISKN